MDAASTLISPPPEDSIRQSGRHQSSQPRFGSEPAQSLYSPMPFASPRRDSDSRYASTPKRKRSNAPSITNLRAAAADSIPEEDDLEGYGQPVEATPNPKPRKQKRREHQLDTSQSPPSRRSKSPHPHSILTSPTHHTTSPSKHIRFVSPHADNAKADYIPSAAILNRPHLSSRGRSRSSTPVPVYEPPSERFTPPREIVLTPTGSHAAPRVSKSSKRKSNAKVLKLVIKKELPEIDLSRPAPPPSPTEDPLLLQGPPHRKSASRATSVVNSRDTPPILSSPPDPHAASPPRTLDFSFTSAGASSPPDRHDELPPPPAFDFTAGADPADDDSSSDHVADEFSGEGEFTGKFRMMSVPTKMDPPTSETRDRIESWGRPISPFPKKTTKGKERAVEEQGDEDHEMEDAPGVASVRSPTPVSRRSASLARMGLNGVNSSAPLAGPGADGDYLHDTGRAHSPQASLGDAGQSPDTSLEYPPSPPPAEPSRPSEREQTPPARRVSPTAPAHDDVEEEDDIPVAPFDNEASQDDMRPRLRSPSSPTNAQSHAQDGSDAPTDSGFEDGSGSSSHAQQLDARHPSPQIHRSPAPESFVAPVASPAKSVEEEELEDEISVWRELSVEPAPAPEDDDENISFELHLPSPEPQPVHSEDVAMAEHDDGNSSEVDQSVVEIVSDDPWAAARAAAILKSHDYDWIAKIGRKRPRSSSVESFSKSARRVDVSASGIRKSMSPRKVARRDSLAALKNRRLTLPQLLHEAEAEVSYSESLHGTPSRTLASPAPYAYRTPSPALSAVHYSAGDIIVNADGPRGWEKNDWKLLDACFTDERLAMARDGDILGDVDLVDLDNVVDRFLDAMGGPEVVESLGESWTRDDLLSRTRALQKKQRAGRIAPSTPTLRRISASPSPFVPDFTPMRRRSSAHTLNLPRLNAPAFPKPPMDAHVPSTLLAPRYSHIMDEVIAIRDGLPRPAPPPPVSAPAPPPVTPKPVNRPRPSLGNRVKGFLFSYLPTMSKPKPAPVPEERLPGLPLPPPEILEKPRGPIATPPAKPAPKHAHPKELVNLQHAPLPPSRLPRPAKRPPRRLVDLRPVSPVPEPSQPVRIPDTRRNSGGSVKDLVRSFEGLDKSMSEELESLRLSRQRSVGELKASARAQWKP
ncbi:hypothetical protein DENSPDRAFT_843562 [Dentipellis sp. KUC8613]|nr:hypothetical protein DENSPDRAFT_843562 [Dentipellis sp. KUC8613]